ncbi:Predicted transcriptional regulator with C-terminal CBS domains [Aquiflexum balticum DSM 16537]|uniref:Predicted transcriptional regulator with C-terminal CBS domains n=1 Tax=Aquiflexum balticum DSM 16537 TaxID=758820 RepID=A0A1W2HA06_9BACT|nr:CBS domain-containing protein [Aquiflexum balticum]SMD45735.1 Predicted transcriptional regulator with C-terminal CBS domains [Aquiflexum balticum DSM 16537]
MNNAERFIQAFNSIENYLRRNLEARNFTSFFNLIDEASQENLIVRQYREELRLFGNLRNAIMHSDRKQGKPVADPREDVVEQIEKIVKMLLDPPLVSQHFLSPVFTVSPEDSMVEVLHAMVEKDYSQVPIIKEGYILGMVNFESIARWMAKITTLESPFEICKKSTIEDVFKATQQFKNYRIIKSNTDFVTAREYFIDSLGKKSLTEALMITENGRRDEPIIGIITISEDLEMIIDVLRGSGKNEISAVLPLDS